MPQKKTNQKTVKTPIGPIWVYSSVERVVRPLKKRDNLKIITAVGAVIIILLTLLYAGFINDRHGGRAFSGNGSGTLEDPYQISTCSQLQEISQSLSSHYALVNDIDCSDTVNWNSGAGFIPIGSSFTGVLDGRNRSIRNITVNSNTSTVGLFRLVSGINTEVKNLHLHQGSINNTSPAGSNYTGSITGRLTGGARLTNVFSSASVTGLNSTGGISGGIDNGTISRAAYRGTITGKAGSNLDLGGIAGIMFEGAINDTLFAGTITHLNTLGIYSNRCGGIVGQAANNTKALTRTYAAGTITCSVGLNTVGGIIAAANTSNETTISQSFASVELTSNSLIGAIVGSSNGAGAVLHQDNYFDATRTSTNNCEGLASVTSCTAVNTVGSPAPNYFFGNSTAAPLNSWDFNVVWKTTPGGYPELRSPPSVTTLSATSVTATEANIKGQITRPGADPVTQVGFEYGLTTNYTENVSQGAPDPYSYAGAFAPLGSPHALARDSQGNLYVTEMANDRVNKYDSNGNFLMSWGVSGSGNGQFDHPYGIAVDSNNNIFVVDGYNNRIQKFNSNGNFILAWGNTGIQPQRLASPYYIDVDTNGNVYVSSIVMTGSPNYSIKKYDNNGDYITAWGLYGANNGQFNFANTIDVKDNSVYVADTYNNRVQKFSLSGEFEQSWGRPELGNDFELEGVAVDNDNNIYTGSYDEIYKFNQAGEILARWGSDGSGPNQFRNPRGMLITPNGTLYVAETFNSRIQIFTANTFDTDILNLSCETTYHFRAFATNSVGTSYGQDNTFTTGACPPQPTVSDLSLTSSLQNSSPIVAYDTVIYQNTVTNHGPDAITLSPGAVTGFYALPEGVTYESVSSPSINLNCIDIKTLPFGDGFYFAQFYQNNTILICLTDSNTSNDFTLLSGDSFSFEITARANQEMQDGAKFEGIFLYLNQLYSEPYEYEEFTNQTNILLGILSSISSETIGPYSSFNIFSLPMNNIASVNYTTATAPSPPENLAIIQSDGTSATLGWDPPADDGGSPITDYLIEFRQANENDWTPYPNTISTNTYETVTSLSPGVSYFFRTYAVNDYGVSLPSNTVQLTFTIDLSLNTTLLNSGPIMSGDTITYRNTLTNNGPGTSTFTDTNIPIALHVVPAGFDYTATNSSNVGCAEAPIASTSAYLNQFYSDEKAVYCFLLNPTTLTAGQDLTYDIIGTADSNFVSDATIRSMGINFFEANRELVEFNDQLTILSGIFMALGGDFSQPSSSTNVFTLPWNNVASATYSYTAPSSTPSPAPEATTNTTPKPSPSSPDPSTPTEPSATPSPTIQPEPTLPNPLFPKYPPEGVKVPKKDTPPTVAESNFLTGFVPEGVLNTIRLTPTPVALALPFFIILVLIALAVLYVRQAWLEYRTIANVRSIIERYHSTQEASQNFVALTSHYLNTPVNIIQASAELLASTKALSQVNIDKLNLAIKNLAEDIKKLVIDSQKTTSRVAESTTELNRLRLKNPLLSVFVVVPSGIVLLILFILNLLFTATDRYSLSFALIVAQITALALGVGILTLSWHTYKRNQASRDALKHQLTLEADVLARRVAFVTQSYGDLNADLSLVKALTKDIPKTDAAQKPLQNGVTMLENVLTTFGRLINFSRPLETLPAPISIAPIIDTALKAQKDTIENKKLSIDSQVPVNLVAPLTQEAAEQLMSSLMDNAVKFNIDNGSIAIHTKTSKRGTQISFTDTGIGIDKTKLSQLMTPFSRATDVLKFDYEGIGLNLYLDKVLLEQIGGELHINSTQGKGTTITLTLPEVKT